MIGRKRFIFYIVFILEVFIYLHSFEKMVSKAKKQARKQAKKKVPKLFTQAKKHPDVRIATRLIRRARRIAMRFRMRLTAHKNEYCKHCHVRMTPGTNARVRIHGSKIIYYCLDCKNYRRIPLNKKRPQSTKKRAASVKRMKNNKAKK